MKKVLLSLVALGILSSGAMAADGATLYKKCIACHGKKAEKKAPGATIILNTLNEDEIFNALKGYKNGTFGAKMKKTMELQVKKLSEDDLKALAAYIVTLK